MNPRRAAFIDWTVGILVYVVVIALFDEHYDRIFVSSFTIALFMAVVMKVLLFLILRLEHVVAHFWKSMKQSTVVKVLSLISAFLILFLSKFVILEILDIIFRENVEIHGFIPIILLILSMIILERGLVVIFKKL